MIDHITLTVKDLDKSREFYTTLLAVLGYQLNIGGEGKAFCGFGTGKEPIFEIQKIREDSAAHTGVHVCFKANNREQVDEFYRAAIECGAKDNGKPGLRPDYTPTYYAAFIFDPDGNNIEACVYD